MKDTSLYAFFSTYQMLGKGITSPAVQKDFQKNSFLFSKTKEGIQLKEGNFFEKLPTLEKISSASQPDFSNTIFVCGLHLLKNIPPMFVKLQEWGAKKIFVVGKSYSNNEEAIKSIKKLGVCVQQTSKQMSLGGFSTAYNADINSMWHNCLKYINNIKKTEGINIVVVDDGGGVLGGIPQEIKEKAISLVGIEQTSSGIPESEKVPYPIIGVANTAVKSWFEPKWVAEQAFKELEKHLIDVKEKYGIPTSKNNVVGIIGVGHIGFAMLKEFLEKGYKNFVINDIDQEKIKQVLALGKKYNAKIDAVNHVWQVIYGADIVLGGTGENILYKNVEMLKVIRMPKILCSLSSKDTEYKELLEHIQKKHRNYFYNPLQNIYYKNGFDAPIIILRGGTPLGFNNTSECVPTHKIELIRALKLQAIKQAHKFLKKEHPLEPGNYMLDPNLQYEALASWHESHSYPLYKSVLVGACHGKFDKESVINAIKENSGGILIDNNNIPDRRTEMKM